MKVLSTIFTLVVVAAAIPRPAASPFSDFPNKRDALPPAASATNHQRAWWNPWCNVPGAACFKKRDAIPEPPPEVAREGWWNPWCNVPGSACFKKRAALPESAPEADARHGWWNPSCNVPGSACYKKREAMAEETPEDARAGWWNPWCNVPGAPCFKKRAAEAVTTVADVVNACGASGQPCDMVKRAAFAINDILKRHVDADSTRCDAKIFGEHLRQDLDATAQSALDGYDHVARQEAAADDRDIDEGDEADGPTDLINYFRQPSTVCAFKRTADPDYDKIKRGATPEDKEQLGQRGNIAETLYEIRDAVAKIKREALEQQEQQAERQAPTGRPKSFHGVEGMNADRFAWGPYGPSTHTMPFLHDIEKRVNAAVDSLEDHGGGD